MVRVSELPVWTSRLPVNVLDPEIKVSDLEETEGVLRHRGCGRRWGPLVAGADLASPREPEAGAEPLRNLGAWVVVVDGEDGDSGDQREHGESHCTDEVHR